MLFLTWWRCKIHRNNCIFRIVRL